MSTIVALSCHRVRGLYFLAVIFAAIMHIIAYQVKGLEEASTLQVNVSLLPATRLLELLPSFESVASGVKNMIMN